MTSTTTAAPRFIQLHQTDDRALRAELVTGLLAPAAHIEPKYFYDALGSRLFDAITELPEYYPTRTEAAIFEQHSATMARCVPPGAVLIDLGAGSCAKAARLFGPLQPAAYLAVDISVDYLREALGALQQRHPQRPMLGLGLDFSQALTLPDPARDWLAGQGLRAAPRCVFYPGSSIGNFGPAEALALLRQARAVCAEGGPGGGILIGVDRLRRRAGRDGGVQPQQPAARQPPAGHRLRSRTLAPCGVLQHRRIAHRDAPGVGGCSNGALAGRGARLCR
jgi:L-histidine Nalpha-methyltransferase